VLGDMIGQVAPPRVIVPGMVKYRAIIL
jgi:hypothetical protein